MSALRHRPSRVQIVGAVAYGSCCGQECPRSARLLRGREAQHRVFATEPSTAPRPVSGRARQTGFNWIYLDVSHRLPFMLRISLRVIPVVVRPKADAASPNKTVALARRPALPAFH